MSLAVNRRESDNFLEGAAEGTSRLDLGAAVARLQKGLHTSYRVFKGY